MGGEVKLTAAQVRALRALDSLPHGASFALWWYRAWPTLGVRTCGALAGKGMVACRDVPTAWGSVQAYGITPAGRRWLQEHDHAG